ncbi:OmpW/AlkL family protein [Pseudidiomarina terrestris]|uniref:Outer membrane beta-barrel protein n=1 Tax=Pseudidiomarina terrestris TaxID=2820060 RepID=A0ABT8MEC5_9GAMM|nr:MULTISPECIES: OmpW family outer membrane protein [unclassified Pseudidiomarina]MDN7128269.1 outer membrane beta-barrel protein [Pseudidiomarina sp. 1APR75-15]MDN7135507.1 outer membrane beta-barrel protein [Pseudidiomarina sp. 1ASP75-5]
MKKSLLVSSLVVLGFAGPAAADISVNVGAIGVMPNDDSASLPVIESVAGMTSGSTGVSVDNNTQLGITFDYQLDKNWSLELIAATPFKHEIHGTGSLAGLKIGETKHLPPTLLAQYHFDIGSERVAPFVGLGVNYTTFFEEKVSPELASVLTDLAVVTANDSVDLALSNSWGYALQAGVNVEMTERWGLHLMVSRMAIDTVADVRINGTTIDSAAVDIDPTVAMLGIRYRF